MAAWFVRKEKGINTPTEMKKEAPDGLWYKCPECKTVMLTRAHRDQAFTCINCQYHASIGSTEYFDLIFDDNQFDELNPELLAADPLGFSDSKPYARRLVDAQQKTGLRDAIRTAHGRVHGLDLVIGCMDFQFIGGSMGSVVGEKIARAIEYARTNRIPLLIISKSGGARMMEAGFSLMQLAKTSARLAQLSEAGVPYLSLLTNPTTGGVTASFAMLGDLNIGEPKALIGFAGPRVIRETIGRNLPEGFQSAEYLLEHGFLDFILNRRELKDKLAQLLRMFAD